MATEQAAVLEIILQSARDFNSEGGAQIDLTAGENSVLFGRGAAIDSLGLVRFILLVEEQVADKFGCAISIASDRALSQKHSPFRTLGSLATFVTELVAESTT